MQTRILFNAGVIFALTACLHAQPVETLPGVEVYSLRVANQSPVATFAAPVSALRFEPRVDVQARNFAEGQADVSIRGGIFENTGFKVGALSLFDPQTGHYVAEIPIAPAMLGAPEIVTGAELALGSLNATAGTVAYSWRRIASTGNASVGAGEFGLFRAELYQGYVSEQTWAGRQVAADVAWGHSDADGGVVNGDHDLNRVSGRLQLAGKDTQTDLFAGYQAKFFGWPNLYTPFNSAESEDLQTVLFALNHRVDRGGGDFFEAGLYHRRNRDDYAFNRFAPVGPVRPFNHTTWVTGGAFGGRLTVGDLAMNARFETLTDKLRSTSLTFGPYSTRTLSKASVAPEKRWTLADGAALRLKAGATYDDDNRGDSALSPVVEISRESPSSAAQRVYLGYSEATQVPTYTALKSSPSAGLFRGNAGLGRSTSRNLEAGVVGTLVGWNGQAAVFHRADDDLVDWTFRRGVTARAANAVDIATTGFELVGRRAWERFDLVLGYTWLTKDEDYGPATVDASFYALNYARHRVTAALTARLGAEFELHWDNEVRVQQDNLLRTIGGDDALLSTFGVTYRPRWCRRLTITVQTDNAWHSEFQEVPAVPASPRQTSALVGYRW